MFGELSQNQFWFDGLHLKFHYQPPQGCNWVWTVHWLILYDRLKQLSINDGWITTDITNTLVSEMFCQLHSFSKCVTVGGGICPLFYQLSLDVIGAIQSKRIKSILMTIQCWAHQQNRMPLSKVSHFWGMLMHDVCWLIQPSQTLFFCSQKCPTVPSIQPFMLPMMVVFGFNVC